MAAFMGRENVLALTIGIEMFVFPCSKKSEISFVFPTLRIIKYTTITQTSW